MKLYILGNSKDDKGTQLEQLTTKILEYQGYTNILTNVQVSGASEIDVTARKMANKISPDDLPQSQIYENGELYRFL